jgi:hypothetical protein
MRGATKEQITKMSKDMDVEANTLRCFRRLMKSDIKSTDIAFDDISFAELAATLEAAVNYINHIKSTWGEDNAHS